MNYFEAKKWDWKEGFDKPFGEEDGILFTPIGTIDVRGLAQHLTAKQNQFGVYRAGHIDQLLAEEKLCSCHADSFGRSMVVEYLVRSGYLEKADLEKIPFVDPHTNTRLYELTQKAFMLVKKPNAA